MTNKTERFVANAHIIQQDLNNAMAATFAGVRQPGGRSVYQKNGTRQPLVIPVHTTIKGRARLHVPFLMESSDTKPFIERQLSLSAGVSRVDASVITGNVLILFDPLIETDEITRALEQIVVCAKRNGVRSNHPEAISRSSLPAIKLDVSTSTENYSPAGALVRDTSQPWHLLNFDRALDFWKSNTTTGLTTKTAQERLQKYGPNSLARAEQRSVIRIFLEQFKSLPVSLLMGSAVLSVLTGGIADAFVILAVVLINAGIGVVTEYHAEKTIFSLIESTRWKVTVLRDGRLQTIRVEHVVPGDILVLKPGDNVPADCRLIESKNLRINEAALTGESFPVAKTVARLQGQSIAIGDRLNMTYKGTVVTGGSARAVAVATGKGTEMGAIQALMDEARPPVTPMQRQLDELGKRMVYLSGATCAAIFALGLVRGYGFLEMLKTVVSLAVAAVPEGLPTVATTTLSLGIRKMRREAVLVRHLDAVETLGSVQVLCLDKTGTLTESRMAVQKIFCGMRGITIAGDRFGSTEGDINPYQDDDLLRLIHIAVLCNEAKVQGENGSFMLNGSATEGALMQMALSAGVAVNSLRARYTKIKVEYRTEGRNFMTILFRAPEQGKLLAVKGNPEEVLLRCRWYIQDGARYELSPETRLAILNENEKMAGEALRVLGFAFSQPSNSNEIHENDLIWLGLAGLADPLRPGVEHLINVFRRAGIRSVMITGDQSATAYAIGKKLNLSGTNNLEMLDSSHMERLEPQLLTALAQKVDLFSRVSPSHKLKIVQALQEAGYVVAMTGDGINDGPALKAADIGIAMGSNGTEAARSVADVVLEHDDLQTLIVALSQGRTIYNNIRKSVHFLMSTNMSEILLVLSSVGAGMGQPLNPMQLLWINLLTDIFPALALSVEPPEPDVLSLPPRHPEKSIISNADLRRYGLESLTIGAATMATYAYGVARYGLGARASTLAFTNLTLAQLLHAYSCRNEDVGMFSVQRLPSNPYLHLAVGGSLSLQLLSIFLPSLRRLLGTVRLGGLDFLALAGGTVLPFMINEATKSFNRSSGNGLKRDVKDVAL